MGRRLWLFVYSLGEAKEVGVANLRRGHVASRP